MGKLALICWYGGDGGDGDGDDDDDEDEDEDEDKHRTMPVILQVLLQFLRHHLANF